MKTDNIAFGFCLFLAFVGVCAFILIEPLKYGAIVSLGFLFAALFIAGLGMDGTFRDKS